MSTTAPVVPDSSPIVLEKAEIRSWKAPIAFGIFVLVSLILFFGFSRHGESTFRFSEKSDAVRLPTLTVDSFVTTTVVTILLIALTLWSAYLSYRARRTPIWVVIVFSLLFMFGFLTWADSGSPYPVPVTGLLLGTISLAVPLVFGALGGVVSERGGVVNVAIEGQLLAGAFVSAMTATLTGSWVVGLIAAMVAGVLVSFLLGAFGIKYLVDQVIVGVVLNVLVVGLTSFLYSKVLAGNPQLLNHPPRLPNWPIPVLSEIPIVGKVLFDQSIIEYLMYIAVFLVWFGLFKTRWGLRLRSVGEHPEAADTVGIKVNSTRFWNVSLAGAIAGLGGAYYTLGSVGAFSKEMTAGQGFIALAAVIFGRWDPIKATLAALLFGFATNLQNVLSTIGSPVPSEFMLMLPYVVTILAVAGLVGISRAPAADGKPYIKS
ncbi:nucleoside ABC transporter membrane protein [Leifsonia sp. 98AMF]|uniref:ABC transporter permease n=1 Tax=Microbacteriaceae TaxID=85023 RepID=UPI000363D8DA|nr:MULTISPECIES: ABC transporter permease [Microbacteriaceae]TDQ02816.1 nucleoside ABC transporter membrane protein [Leifsonia sp. 115AMFTsu3.1]SDH17804.1 nucleoside ABC transporter membrane protein [Leifsonia sp. 197AMF]SDJ20609.1 nucleoside ABC transporter membrane protein [Leifsonia sp. 466MF]SDJ44873.1 nucleoside ABC transporter membrane protein [Leifsonia sp. 157MF]SDN42166.1 nucleoside ABC transporter membrane protein [Leifsonia sp. 509MF]